MNRTPSDVVPATEAAAEAAAHDLAAAWRIPRLLDLIADVLEPDDDESSPASARRMGVGTGAGVGVRVLVVEPGRGLLGRALADRLGAADHVTVVAGQPEDVPPAPGGTLDEAFVERRPHAAAVDVRAAAAAGWPLERDERGTFHLLVIAGGLAWTSDPARLLADAGEAMTGDGRLFMADHDPTALALHPPVPRFESAWRHRLTRRSMRGRDDARLRRMPELLDRHRLRAITGGIASHGAFTGEDDFDGVVRLLADLVRGRFDDSAAARSAAPGTGGRGRLGDANAGTDPDADQAADALERWRGRPGAVVWWPMPWIVAARA